MEAEKLSLSKGNGLIKKRFILLMKEHKDFFQEKESHVFSKIKDHFLHSIWFWNDSSYGPTFKCHIRPAFFPDVGSTCYALGECIRYKKMLAKEEKKIDFFDIRIYSSNEKPWYPINKLDVVWENNKYLIEQIVIPYMDQLDFDKMITMLKSGKDELFETYNRYSYEMQFTFAVACLLKKEYQEGYQKLVEVKDHFFDEAERLLGNRDLKIFKEAEQLIRIGNEKALKEARRLTGYYDVFDMMEAYDMKSKADYIKELLIILEQKIENWEDRLEKRITDEEKNSIEMIKGVY